MASPGHTLPYCGALKILRSSPLSRPGSMDAKGQGLATACSRFTALSVSTHRIWKHYNTAHQDMSPGTMTQKGNTIAPEVHRPPKLALSFTRLSMMIQSLSIVASSLFKGSMNVLLKLNKPCLRVVPAEGVTPIERKLGGQETKRERVAFTRRHR